MGKAVGTRAALADAAGLLAGYGIDLLLGDPRRWHPVAGFGRAAAALERRLYAPRQGAGVSQFAQSRRWLKKESLQGSTPCLLNKASLWRA